LTDPITSIPITQFPGPLPGREIIETFNENGKSEWNTPAQDG